MTLTINVAAIDPGSPAAELARVVAAELELSPAGLGELLGDTALGPWLAIARNPAGRRPGAKAAAAGVHPGSYMTSRIQRREMRDFADQLGRSEEYIRPGWTEAEGNRNKYRYPVLQSLQDDYDRWAAAGRPDLRTWQGARGPRVAAAAASG